MVTMRPLPRHQSFQTPAQYLEELCTGSFIDRSKDKAVIHAVYPKENLTSGTLSYKRVPAEESHHPTPAFSKANDGDPITMYGWLWGPCKKRSFHLLLLGVHGARGDVLHCSRTLEELFHLAPKTFSMCRGTCDK